MQRVKLAEIIRPRKEKVAPSSCPDLPFIGMEHVEAHSMRLLGTVPAGTMRSAANRFYPGDVLYGRLRPYLNKVYKPVYDGLCSAEFIVLPKTEGIHPDFLRYRLNAQDFVSFASQLNAGDRPRVDFDQISSFEIFLPSYLTQTRIVAEIEKHFSRLDEAVANLKRVKANLKRYKAAVLKAAVEGKLTEEWRKQHPDVEPADKLLERILAERRKAAGKGKYKEPVGPDTSGLPELPEGWVWATYEQVGRLQLGRQRAPKYHSGPHMRPYLRVQNVFEDRIDLSDVMEMDFPPADYERYQLTPGDLLLNEGQSPELLGRPAIYRGELPGACFTNTLIRFRPAEGVSVDYALIVSRHNMHSGRFVDEGTITTNIAHLSVGRLAPVELPLPPSSEQVRIVAEVARQLSILSETETQVDANLRRADRLRQSILKQAFSGQLVPPDPNDEPASVLLDRIRTNANVGATHASPKSRSTIRARHASPLRETHPTPAVSDDFTSLDSVIAAILNRMQPGREYSRAEIADPLGLSTGRWNAAIQELRRRGKVTQVGEKRGTRYMAVLAQ